MSRSRFVLAVLALSLVAQACTLATFDYDMKGCEDMFVGDQTNMVADAGIDLPALSLLSEWTLVSGPGTLEPYSENQHIAQYTATEPGAVSIAWEGFTPRRSDGIFQIGDESLPLWGVGVTARCELEVFAATVAQAEGTGFDVSAVVTVSTVEGLLPIGMESAATWRFVFDCEDGRCDAEVRDGGPFGGMAPFTAAYQADVENFVFDFVLDTPANEECGDDRWVGEITPLSWDEEGPLGFSFRMVNVLTCDSGDIVVEWVGEGTRG